VQLAFAESPAIFKSKNESMLTAIVRTSSRTLLANIGKMGRGMKTNGAQRPIDFTSFRAPGLPVEFFI
jgi:hypothetical protein